ncbi:MAG: peroxiredoxin [Porticoccaceae bacterium]|nr:MAG: peroxiredoxin [Porticoccaceae bacterium]
MARPQVGETAPSFVLPNQRGEPVSLEALRGRWVVLYFYPKAMTPGCTTQACGIRDHRAEFDALGAVVLGVSPDPVARLARFAERDRLDFDLLSDEDHAVAEAYGVWGPKKFMGREYEGIHRVTFIIDPEGRIAHLIPKVNTKTHAEEVLAWLREHR